MFTYVHFSCIFLNIYHISIYVYTHIYIFTHTHIYIYLLYHILYTHIFKFMFSYMFSYIDICVCVSARYLPWSIFQVWQGSGLLKRFGPQGYSKCNVSWWGASCNYSICTEPGPREGPPGWEIRTCRSFDKCRIFLNISPWAQHVPTYWLYHVVSLFRFFGSWHKKFRFWT